MALEKIKICVTGGNGFIGVHLIDFLKKDKSIIVVPFEGDLLVKKDIDNFFSKNKDISQVIHLVGTFFGDFDKLMDINFKTTKNLLDALVKYEIKKIIFTSSGAVYGEPVKSASLEMDVLKPNTPYGLVKMFTESLIQFYSQINNLNYIILRFPNVYGIGNNKGVIYNFLKSIKDSEKVTIFGTGMQKRNFLFIDDAIEALYASLSYNKNNIFNIADENVYNLNEVISILKNFNLDFNTEYQSAEKSNALQTLSENISFAKRELKWKPKTPLNVGLKKYLILLNNLHD